MDEPLVRFLSQVRSRLAGLSDDEQARRFDAVVRDLEQSLAAELAAGRDEAAAVALAIARVRRSVWTGATGAANLTATLSLPPLSPVGGAVLRCVIAYWLFQSVSIDFLIRLGLWLFRDAGHLFLSPVRPIPGGPSAWDFRTSTLLSGIACAVLLLSEGWPRLLSGFQERNTLAGAAVRWIALRNLFGIALWSTALILLRILLEFDRPGDGGAPEVVYWLQAALNALILLVPVAALVAGWLTARCSPQNGLPAVRIAAATSALLYAADAFDYMRRYGGDVDRQMMTLIFVFQAALGGAGLLGAWLATRGFAPPRPPALAVEQSAPTPPVEPSEPSTPPEPPPAPGA